MGDYGGCVSTALSYEEYALLVEQAPITTWPPTVPVGQRKLWLHAEVFAYQVVVQVLHRAFGQRAAPIHDAEVPRHPPCER